MKLTPLEVKQKKFPTAFRGYVGAEVDEYLRLVAEEMEELSRDNNELKDRVKALEEMLEAFRSREKTLKETLVTAQKMAEEVKVVAERESQVIRSNAELEGERVIKEAMRRRESLVHEIHDLKRQKVQFESTLRNAIEVHLKMLDALHDLELDLNAGERSARRSDADDPAEES